MSQLSPKINNNILYRNNQTLQYNSLSDINKKDYLPNIHYHKKTQLNTLNNSNNIKIRKIKIKSPNMKHSIKYSLLNPKKIPNIKPIYKPKKRIYF